MKRKRSQLEVIHDMLAATQARGGRIKPTKLLSKSNLSYKMMQEYLELLFERSLLVEEPGKKGKGREYVITTQGQKFLFEYERMAAFTEAFGL